MIALLLLAQTLSVPGAAETTHLALVIANNHSLDEGVQPLRFADDDAARLFTLLSGLGYHGHLLTVLDPDTAEQHPEVVRSARPPTWPSLKRAVADLKSTAKRVHEAGGEVDLLVTYSGHGAVGLRGSPYINLLDVRLHRGDFFREVVGAVDADFVHVVIDACRAHDFVDARGGPDGPDFDRELSLFLARERRFGHPEVGVVVAESADGETHEWARTRSGIFAHEVLSGLSGAADVNGDGLVEYSEMHSFVSAANASIKDPRARLRVVAEAPALNPRRPLLDLRSAQSLERVRTPRNGGWFAIEDDRGVRWVDAHLAEGNSATIHLPRRGRYFVLDVRRSTEALVELNGTGAAVGLETLRFDALARTAARGSIASALRRGLFHTPYGSRYYGGFVAAMRYPSVLSDADDAEDTDDLPAQRRLATSGGPSTSTEPQGVLAEAVAPPVTEEEAHVPDVEAVAPPVWDIAAHLSVGLFRREYRIVDTERKMLYGSGFTPSLGFGADLFRLLRHGPLHHALGVSLSAYRVALQSAYRAEIPDSRDELAHEPWGGDPPSEVRSASTPFIACELDARYQLRLSRTRWYIPSPGVRVGWGWHEFTGPADAVGLWSVLRTGPRVSLEAEQIIAPDWLAVTTALSVAPHQRVGRREAAEVGTGLRPFGIEWALGLTSADNDGDGGDGIIWAVTLRSYREETSSHGSADALVYVKRTSLQLKLGYAF